MNNSDWFKQIFRLEKYNNFLPLITLEYQKKKRKGEEGFLGSYYKPLDNSGRNKRIFKSEKCYNFTQQIFDNLGLAGKEEEGF